MKSAIIILNHHLRLEDNPALYEASQSHERLIAVYLHSGSKANASDVRLHHRLKQLESSVFCVDVSQGLQTFVDFCRFYHADTVFINAVHRVHLGYWKTISQSLEKAEIQSRSVEADLIDYSGFLNKQGGFFKVYTPFWKAWVAQACLREPLPKVQPYAVETTDYSCSVEDLGLLPKIPWADDFYLDNELDDFLDNRVADYAEYAPTGINEPLNDRFSEFPWSKEKDETFIAWTKGQTGIPLVDAGMRELWHTGYMHNRVRMVVASFLTKNLMKDWRLGAEWFEHTLCDADLFINRFSWQWVAGCGRDAAPYFRIFNPITQSQKFDPDGTYIRKWVPELAHLKDKKIHEPWTWAPNYPRPLVDLKQSRVEALEAYHSTS
jgi:deoxyribodipyrimidine photolyase